MLVRLSSSLTHCFAMNGAPPYNRRDNLVIARLTHAYARGHTTQPHALR